MLLKFEVENFYCFKEGIEVSFMLNSNCPESISKGKNYSNAMCIKGANGSGKTKLLKALSALFEFCKDSFLKKPDELIDVVVPFYGNENPTKFSVNFIFNNVEYVYELELTKESVISEKIFRDKERRTPLVHRKSNDFDSCTEEFKGIKVIKLRSNASIISTAHQYEVACMEPLYFFFNNVFGNAIYGDLMVSNNKPILAKISELLNKNKDYFEFTKDSILKCDLGINNIKIESKEDGKGNVNYYPIFEHLNSNKAYPLDYESESSGTKSLFLTLLFYKAALKTGGLILMDEFDNSLHPDILPVLINFFTNDKYNTKDSQILFTTHNDKIIDDMGKYRTIIINKDNNESFGYRLNELPGDMIRNDRPISPLYNSGKIGGVPRL